MANADPQVTEKVQTPDSSTPQGRGQLREKAVADARDELDLPADSTDNAPQAVSDDTGDAEPTDDEPQGEPDDKPADDAPEVDWTDSDQRTAELDRRDTVAKEQADNRLSDQKRSLTGEFAREREGYDSRIAGEETAALLRNLDNLRDTDPDAFGDRINSDPQAAAAIATRTAEPTQEQLERASMYVVRRQQVQLFGAMPELEEVASEGGDAWQEAANGEHGIFGHLVRTAAESGAKDGVAKYLKSSDYKKAIVDAEQRGKQSAMTELGISGPPPSDNGSPPDAPQRQFDNPRQRAAEAARRQRAATGNPTAIDPASVSRGKQPAAAS